MPTPWPYPAPVKAKEVGASAEEVGSEEKSMSTERSKGLNILI